MNNEVATDLLSLNYYLMKEYGCRAKLITTENRKKFELYLMLGTTEHYVSTINLKELNNISVNFYSSKILIKPIKQLWTKTLEEFKNEEFYLKLKHNIELILCPNESSMLYYNTDSNIFNMQYQFAYKSKGYLPAFNKELMSLSPILAIRVPEYYNPLEYFDKFLLELNKQKEDNYACINKSKFVYKTPSTTTRICDYFTSWVEQLGDNSGTQ